MIAGLAIALSRTCACRGTQRAGSGRPADNDMALLASYVRPSHSLALTLAPASGGASRVFDDPAFALVPLRGDGWSSRSALPGGMTAPATTMSPPWSRRPGGPGRTARS